MLTQRLPKSFTQALLIALLLVSAVARGSAQTPAGPNGEVTLTVSEQFLNSFLEAMFTNLKAPSVPLVITPSDKDRSPADAHGCVSAITLQKEEAGVKTSVKLERGKISAPLAFSGAYNSTLLGCIEFHGWADTSWNLEFDRTRQTLLARVQVNEIRMTNLPALATGSLVKLVQGAVDQRINPLELFKVDQLSARLPIAPANGALRLRAKEVRPEIVPGLLYVHVNYEFLPDR